MSINTEVNYPLLRELVEMGVLSSESSPNVVGPFQVRADAFAGDSSGETETLTETPIGVQLCVALQTDGTASNAFSILTEDTHFTLEDETLTWITDQSANQILIQYAY